MKKMIKLLLIISCSFLVSFTNVFAATKTIIIDNDALSSAPGDNGSSYGFTYGTGSGNYNNDYRIAKPGTSSHYQWASKSVDYEDADYDVNYYVYLNNVKFTCPKAFYELSTSPVGTKGIIKNQDTAPGGWNTIITHFGGAMDYVLAIDVSCHLSSGGGNVGADAAKMTYPN